MLIAKQGGFMSKQIMIAYDGEKTIMGTENSINRRTKHIIAVIYPINSPDGNRLFKDAVLRSEIKRS